jgi:hypothetical protein
VRLRVRFDVSIRDIRNPTFVLLLAVTDEATVTLSRGFLQTVYLYGMML